LVPEDDLFIYTTTTRALATVVKFLQKLDTVASARWRCSKARLILQRLSWFIGLYSLKICYVNPKL